MGLLNHKYCIRDILWISYIPVRPGPVLPREPCGTFGPGAPRPSSHHSLSLQCAAPQSQPPTGSPDAVCPAQTATAIG